AVTFVLLADESKLRVPTGWEQDLGAAAENMLLEAVHLGLGGVWLGVATADFVTENVRKLFELPGNIRPFALISVGYPDGQKNQFVDRYLPERVHYEKW
ncbi:MAG: nitroreductase, partial [Herbinix sp.]|nr:nitroreductase [Herbinix sp.]